MIILILTNDQIDLLLEITNSAQYALYIEWIVGFDTESIKCLNDMTLGVQPCVF
jgi:hypothetical protein